VELSWFTKLKITAAVTAGVVVIGLLAWPLVAPPEPFGVVSVFAGGISFNHALALAGLAFLTGLLACLLSWPYGRQIGMLAVPAGLAVWAVRSGSMTNLVSLNAAASRRQAIFTAFEWEPLFWLAIVAVGFLGTLLGYKIQSKFASHKEEQDSKTGILIAAVALVSSVLIAQFCIKILAQDVRIDSFVAQPLVGQIVFAVLVSFGLAAFIVKVFLNAGYLWPIIASAFVTFFVSTVYVNQEMLQRLVQHYPPVFSPNAVIAILPVQMVALGTLGSIAGYWMAVRYSYWRQHPMQ